MGIICGGKFTSQRVVSITALDVLIIALIAKYAVQNSLRPYDVFDAFVKDYRLCLSYERVQPCLSRRWYDVEEYLRAGRLTEAINLLEADVGDGKEIDWSTIVQGLSSSQPSLADALKLSLTRPASRESLIQALGSLSRPFVLVK